VDALPGSGESRGLLLHTCCAWCLLDVLEEFGRDYSPVVVGFFNPNIHPRREFERRLKSARLLAERLGLRFVSENDYGLAPFLSDLYNAGVDPAAGRSGRCSRCYRLRMRRAAGEAKRLELGSFATTLLSSPYQLHGELTGEAERAAAEFGVAFDGRETVALHGTGRERVPSGLKLYRQRYCGCIFSESESFKPT